MDLSFVITIVSQDSSILPDRDSEKRDTLAVPHSLVAGDGLGRIHSKVV
jgi:hypothetical protein